MLDPSKESQLSKMSALNMVTDLLVLLIKQAKPDECDSALEAQINIAMGDFIELFTEDALFNSSDKKELEKWELICEYGTGYCDDEWVETYEDVVREREDQIQARMEELEDEEEE